MKIEGSEHEAGRRGLQQPGTALEVRIRPFVVRIEEREQPAAGRYHAGVASGCAAAVAVEPNQPEAARGRHLLSEPLITVDGATATATTDYAFVAKNLTVMSAGRYHDTLRHDGDRWRIASRE